MAATFHEVAVFTVGGGDLRPLLRSAQLELQAETVAQTRVTRRGLRHCIAKRQAQLVTEQRSATASGCAVTGLNLDALGWGGDDWRPDVLGGQMVGRMRLLDASGAVDVWRAPQVVHKDFAVMLDLRVPYDGAAMGRGSVADLAGLSGDLSLTINGVTMALPTVLTGLTWGVREGDLQRVRVRLAGRDPGSGPYPTLPTGTATLLDWGFVQPEVPLALSLRAHAGAETWSGSFVFNQFGFRWKSGAPILTRYALTSVGPVTYGGGD